MNKNGQNVVGGCLIGLLYILLMMFFVFLFAFAVWGVYVVVTEIGIGENGINIVKVSSSFILSFLVLYLALGLRKRYIAEQNNKNKEATPKRRFLPMLLNIIAWWFSFTAVVGGALMMFESGIGKDGENIIGSLILLLIGIFMFMWSKRIKAKQQEEFIKGRDLFNK